MRYVYIAMVYITYKIITCIYNSQLGLENKLKEIELPKSWPWIEKLNTTVNTLIEIKNIEDDHERETTLYV